MPPCFTSHRQEALLAAISEKDANIALLELSSSKKKKTQDEVAMLKREKDRLVQQLKQQVGLLRNILWYFFLTHPPPPLPTCLPLYAIWIGTREKFAGSDNSCLCYVKRQK